MNLDVTGEMRTGEDAHGSDYFTSLFLLRQLCNSTLLSAILLVGVIGKFMAELGELTVLFEAGLGCPPCM